MEFTHDYLAELSRRTDLVELIGANVELKRAGRLLKGLCPFHNEKTPSFTVYPEDNSFHCFGCGAGGDAITFTMRIQNLTFPEAVRYLASRSGMPLPDEDDTAGKARRRLLAANREAAKFFAEALNTAGGRDARAYLRHRGLSDKIIRRFGLGLAPDTFGALRDHLRQQGFTEDEMLAAGLAKRSQKGTVYDTFRGRLMFPIIDLQGQVIAFGGRIMGEGGPKYLNSSDTPVFKKSKGLFALNLAKKSPARRYILAEGYMDVISLHQAGFDTAVASLGTALTDEQAKLLSNYADEIVICYDADEAGQKATARAIEKLAKTQVKVRVLTVKDAKDPDEFIKMFGGEQFRQLLDGSGNTIEYALAKLAAGFDLGTPDGRAGYIRAALDILAEKALPAEQDIYAGRIAQETDVEKATVLRQLEGVLQQHQRRRVREREARIKGEGNAAGVQVPYSAAGKQALGVAYAEQQVVVAALKNPKDVLPLVSAAIQPGEFLSPEFGKIYAMILDIWRAGDEVALSPLGSELDEREMSLLTGAIAKNHDAVFSERDIGMMLERIKSGAGISKKDVKDEADVYSKMEEMKKRKNLI